MTLIEKLIVEPSEETTELLFEDESLVFWVDWREDDSVLAEYCDSIIKTNKLSSHWKGDELIVQYGEISKKVPLTLSGSDRHITLLTINEILDPDYEVRMVWDSDGGDTLAFTILSTHLWCELESKFGVQPVSKAFLRLTSDLNTFTDPLHKHRPGTKSKGKWWEFWK